MVALYNIGDVVFKIKYTQLYARLYTAEGMRTLDKRL